MTEQRIYKIVDAVKRAVRSSAEKKKYSLKLTSASALIESVFAIAKERGVKVAVAIADTNGRTLMRKAMNGVAEEHLIAAENKAFTASVLKLSTALVGELSADGKALCGIKKTNNGRIETSGGGNPLIYCGRVIGGIGVSGADEQTSMQLSMRGTSLVDKIIN